MTGIFDSGLGGLAALNFLRALSPNEDIVFFRDREHAPYGIRNEEELLPLVARDIDMLTEAGADRVLMACCTASTVYRLLDKKRQRTATPIIGPTAMVAAEASRGNIAVIATERTVASHAFSEAVSSFSAARVCEYAAQELVAMVEGGEHDGHISASSQAVLEAILAPIKASGADTLILGCTHFSHLRGEIGKILKNVNIIDSALEGARAIANKIDCGTGRTVYL